MITTYWSVKGGAGVTASTVGIGAVTAAQHPVVLVDFAGDLPVALGAPTLGEREGITDWLHRRTTVSTDALADLIVPVTNGLSVIPFGHGDRTNVTVDDARDTLAALENLGDVIIDGGVVSERDGFGTTLAACTSQSVLVTRSCYLSLHRATQLPFRPSSLLLIAEPGRALTRRDIEDALGVSVQIAIPYDPAIARALDAGVLHVRPPKIFERACKPSKRKYAA